jgi:hypothetical protein
MRKRTSNKTLLIGGVAALVILGGGGLWLATRSSEPAAPAAAEGEAGHAEEEGDTPRGRPPGQRPKVGLNSPQQRSRQRASRSSASAAEEEGRPGSPAA